MRGTSGQKGAWDPGCPARWTPHLPRLTGRIDLLEAPRGREESGDEGEERRNAGEESRREAEGPPSREK